MEKSKGLVSDIVGKIAKDKAMSKPETPATLEKPDDEGSMGLESCGEDVMSAFKSGDSKALTSALRNFVQMLGDGSEETDENDGGAGESDEEY